MKANCKVFAAHWCRKYYIVAGGAISGVRNWILWGIKRRKGNLLLFPSSVQVRVLKITYWQGNSEIQLDHQILHMRTASRFFSVEISIIDLPLYAPCIMFQCVDKPTRCNTSYEWSLLSINWLYMFRTITSPSSGASSHKLYYTVWYNRAIRRV